MSHGTIILATCNAILLLRDVKLAKRVFITVFFKYSVSKKGYPLKSINSALRSNVNVLTPM